MEQTNDITIIGGGLAANLAVAYLRKHLPDLRVVVVGKNDRRRPIVGESTTEFTVRFMYEIGMGALLEERHNTKYGLTWYHKEKIDDPTCSRYFINEVPGLIRMPSFNLNRDTFDADLEALNRARGAEFVEATVKNVEVGTNGEAHRVTYEEKGEVKTITTRWLIDATGRRNMLARKLKLIRPAKYQRSSFWFRLKDFDPNIFSSLKAIKMSQHNHDSYNSTHHLFGRGNWMWMIPLRDDESGPRSLISIGMCFRPDVYPHAKKLTNIDEFLVAVEKEHPVVANMVRSGTVVDTNVYNNYMYDTERCYSRDGWFLLGDAAKSYDPLFSIGIVFSCLGVTQIAAMIDADRKKKLTQEYVDALNFNLYKSSNRVLNGVGWFYEIMHDPVKAAWTLSPSALYYFHFALPSFINGWTSTIDYKKVFDGEPKRLSEDDSTWSPILDLAVHVAEHTGPTLEVMRARYTTTINWPLDRDHDIPPQVLLSHAIRKVAEVRMDLLKYARWDVRAVNYFKAGQEIAVSTMLNITGRLKNFFNPIERPFHFFDRQLDGVPMEDYWPKLPHLQRKAPAAAAVAPPVASVDPGPSMGKVPENEIGASSGIVSQERESA